ncbi:MAG: Mycothiol acetyltransferase [Actinomycetota bacterium]|jgi:predicted GNAT family acetyltransferase
MTAPAIPSSRSAETDGVVRPLAAADLPEFRRLLNADPVAHCFVSARLAELSDSGHRMAADFWVVERGGRCVAALHVGANVVPIATDDGARRVLAERLRRTGRRGSSLVGPSGEVLDLWDRLDGAWGPARDVRARQPLLVIDRPSAIAADPHVRAVRMQELDLLVPACIAMFTEEVGISPVTGGAGAAYRARISDLVREGRALARIDDGRVVFKAEIGAATDRACQIQGVWVAPEFRGRGISEPGMAAVVEIARREVAPLVSLYVNDYNVRARRCYEAVGFRGAGEFATVLL